MPYEMVLRGFNTGVIVKVSAMHVSLLSHFSDQSTYRIREFLGWIP